MEKRDPDGENWCSCFFESIFRFAIWPFCKRHDELYDVGGGYQERYWSDRDLALSIWEHEEAKWYHRLFLLLPAAIIVYIGIRIGASYLFCRYIFPGYQRFHWRDAEGSMKYPTTPEERQRCLFRIFV
jgi:hypothetical protein